MSKSKSHLTLIQKKNNFAHSLEEVLRQGASQLPQLAIEAEVDSFIEKFKADVDENGYRLAVRNGYHKERNILSSLGPVTVQQPRVDDRKLRERFPDATVRLRTKRTKGCGSREATLTMVFKLAKEAEKSWHKLRSFGLLPFVMAGEKFIDGEHENEELKKRLKVVKVIRFLIHSY